MRAAPEDKAALVADMCGDAYHDSDKAMLRALLGWMAKESLPALECAYGKAAAKGRLALLETVYESDPAYNPDFLLSALWDPSKAVREWAIAALSVRKDLAGKARELAKSRKKTVREAAQAVLLALDGDSVSSGPFDVLAYTLQYVPLPSPAAIKWASMASLPRVRLAGSEAFADGRILAGYVHLFTSQTAMEIPKAARPIRDCLEKNDLRAFGRELYAAWKAGGANVKHRGVLALAAIDADDAFIPGLQADILGWAAGNKGKLASDAVWAMALQGGNLALYTVASMARKPKSARVMNAAREAFAHAAHALGLDPETLEDRVIPNLGFDENGTLTIDYGPRFFTATITPDLRISLAASDGKAIKSLPAINERDDQSAGRAAKEAFAALKKSLKGVVSAQGGRLEMALATNRAWRKKSWIAIFIENPVMNLFAIGLIWGVYDEAGILAASFRYMGDGTFSGADGHELEIGQDAAIGLVHPVELAPETLSAWQGQLADYELVQPIIQLARKAYSCDEGEGEKTALDAFAGIVVQVGSLCAKLQKSGWSLGPVQDSGFFLEFRKEDERAGAGARLFFSGACILEEPAREVTVYDMAFYRLGAGQPEGLALEGSCPGVAIALGLAPRRFYSEACHDIDHATVDPIRVEKDWERGACL
jgi:hypothetical protein